MFINMNMKYCSRCETDKPLSEFGKKGTGVQPYCKPCNRAYQREHYQSNKSAYKEDMLSRRWSIRAKALRFVMEYAADGCPCGEKDFRALEFDHIDPSTKEHTISQLVSSGYSIERIKRELDKCQIICANCHKKKTADQQGWYKLLENY